MVAGSCHQHIELVPETTARFDPRRCFHPIEVSRDPSYGVTKISIPLRYGQVHNAASRERFKVCLPNNMFSLRSWRAQGACGSSDRYTDVRTLLPKWRTPSPQSRSKIPPSIVDSVYSASTGQSTRSIVFEQPTAQLDREEELQADLQFLLDAQAEGLLKGLGKITVDNGESNGSVTPTTSSVRGQAARKPTTRRPGLRTARKGIYNSILALSEIKDEELQTADNEVLEKEEVLERIGGWEQKRKGLLEATGTVEEDEETIRAHQLKQEANVLQEEINHVEMQLSDMKAHHRKLVKQAADAENSMQAKLASYTSSLSMLEDDIRKFLASESEKPQRPQSNEPSSSMWQMSPKRRTLDMARTKFGYERDDAWRRRGKVECEKKALDEGARIWGRVASRISDFEKLLRFSVPHEGASMSESSNAAWEDQEEGSPDDQPSNLRVLLTKLSALISSIEDDYKHVEERQWNLLIAAIGAELDALRHGKQILESLVGSQGSRDRSTDAQDATNGEVHEDQGSEIHNLDRSFEAARRRPSSRATSDTDEDAAPEELLFSKHVNAD